MRRLEENIEVLQAIVAVHASQVPQRPLPQPEPEADFTWKIVNFTRKLAQAKSDNHTCTVQSEPFFCSHGYKVRLEINLRPMGYAEYVGVYLGLVKSDRDGTLPWPFTKCVTFILVDQQDDLRQRQNIEKTLIPNVEEVFKRPRQRENAAMGFSDFVKHSTLRTRKYITDHAVYIKVLVDP